MADTKELTEKEQAIMNGTTVFCAGCSVVIKVIPKEPGMPGSTYSFCPKCAPTK
jgi:hypothetical protein